MPTRAFYKSLHDLLKLERKPAKPKLASKRKSSNNPAPSKPSNCENKSSNWQKEVAQSKKTHAQTAPPAQTDAEPSPQTQKMAA
jgi:hypothetical protein